MYVGLYIITMYCIKLLLVLKQMFFLVNTGNKAYTSSGECTHLVNA